MNALIVENETPPDPLFPNLFLSREWHIIFPKVSVVLGGMEKYSSSGQLNESEI